MIKTGIDDIAFYISPFYLNLQTLAEKRGTDYNKFYTGIGIEKIAIPAPDEDIVTLAANAALPLLERCDPESIGTLLFATESGIDQSKSAGIFVHDLLKLPQNCRVVELKQACYSSTAAVQAACAMTARNPEKNILVISSDIARYDLNSPGESTQGCGAVAMIIKKDPRILEIFPESGCYCANVWDFWRPNYLSNPKYDGKYSMISYLHAAKSSWRELASSVPDLKFDNISKFCYHLPFSTMGLKTHLKLAREIGSSKTKEELEKQISSSALYCRQIGNCYSASLYISFCSLLDNDPEDLAGKTAAIFSYGSGCVGEFYYGRFSPEYKKMLRKEENKKIIKNRKEIDFQTYLDFYNAENISPKDSGSFQTPKITKGRFRLKGIEKHCRIYERCRENVR